MAGLTWLLFIHGFNVSAPEAAKQWTTLKGLLSLDGEVERIHTGLFLWPSDSFGRWPTSYPKMIKPAKQAGTKLGDYLATLRDNPLILVGHSMGALVAVEAALAIRLSQRPKPQGLVLLGAAVDESELRDSGAYRHALADHEAVGFSSTDWALKRPFRLGAKAAAPFEPKPEAVGLHGHPSRRAWLSTDSLRSDHSYWQLPVSAYLTRWALDEASLSRQTAERNVGERRPDERQVELRQ